MTQRIGIFRVHTTYPTLYQLTESLNLRHRTLAHIHRKEYRLLNDLPQTDAISLSRLDNLTYRRITDTTSRIINDTLKSLFVVRIGYQSEIGYHVFYLLTLIEAQSPINAIRDIILAHLFLKAAAL